MIEIDKALAARMVAGAAAGLTAGLFASFAMNAFQRLLPAPNEPDELPATVVAADRIFVTVTGRRLAERHHAIAGDMVHYGLGAVVGGMYGLAAEFRPQVARGGGLPFGIGVALVLDEIAVPALAITAPPWKFGPKVHLYSIVSHMVFGFSAELTRQTWRFCDGRLTSAFRRSTVRLNDCKEARC